MIVGTIAQTPFTFSPSGMRPQAPLAGTPGLPPLQTGIGTWRSTGVILVPATQE